VGADITGKATPTDDTVGAVVKVWTQIREKKPLIHHITNLVVMNETANITLAAGALPVMAHAREEVEEMSGIAAALVLNIGTLTPELVDTMIVAAETANTKGIPVVLDPVGAGATSLRTDSARRIMNEVAIAIVRGNAGELSILAGLQGEVKGVESVEAHEDLAELAGHAATKLGCTVAVTGATDHVSDGTRSLAVENGHPWLGTVTGTGCMATTVVAAAAAVEKDHPLAAAAALSGFGVAGELAAGVSQGPGSFHVALYDALANLDASRLGACSRVRDSGSGSG